jgi:small subunit ribosomal protein S2
LPWQKLNVLASLPLVWWIPTAILTKWTSLSHANDDATKSIAIITNYITAAIIEGLQERESEKDKMDENDEEGNENGDVVALGEEGAEGDEAKKAPRKKATGTRRTTSAAPKKTAE